jgi:hypothetical protein
MLSRRNLSKPTGESPKLPPHLEKRCKEMNERRRILEQSRSMNVRRIQQEIQRIAQRELDYAERLIAEYAPIKLSLNESAWSRWQEFLPIRMDFVETHESSSASTPAAPEETSSPSPDAPIA